MNTIELLNQKLNLLRRLKYLNHKLDSCFFDMRDLKQAGYRIEELKDDRRIPFNIINFDKRNYDILIDAGYTPEEIKGYLKKQKKLTIKREYGKKNNNINKEIKEYLQLFFEK